MAKQTFKQKIVKRSTAKVVKSFDPYKAKKFRIDYFDDRFYRLQFPKKTPEEYIKNILESRRFISGNLLYIYLDSVTTVESNTIVKKWISNWRGIVGNEVADKTSKDSMLKGTNIHNAAEKLVQGYTIILQNPNQVNITARQISALKKKDKKIWIVTDQAEMLQVQRLKKLLKLLNPKVIETERNLFNLDLGYAGTLDQLWEMKGGIYTISRMNTLNLEDGYYITDFKTGKGFDEKEYFTQLSAYAKAHPSAGQIKGCLIIHLNSDTRSGIFGVKVYHMTLEMIDEYFEYFKNLLKVYRFKNDLNPVHFTIDPICKL